MKRYKVLLITGASSGIGKEIAYALAPQTEQVVLVARRFERLEALAKDLSVRFGTTAFALTADLSEPSEAERVFEKTIELTGRPPDILVNNAGVGFCGDTTEIPLEAERKMVALNVEAPFILCKLVLKTMYARRKGVILNVASIAGFLPGPYMAAYFASKAFVLSYSEAISEEARAHGVRVLTLCPGTVDTDFFTLAGAKRGFLRKTFDSSPQAVATAAVRAILDGYPDRVVPGIPTKLLIVLLHLIPSPLARFLSGKFLQHGVLRA